MKVIQSDFYNQFQCVGEKCRRNCCSVNWNINIDKETYKLYQKTDNVSDELRKLFDENLEILEKPNQAKYARIKSDYRDTLIVREINEQKAVKADVLDVCFSIKCPFIEEEGLCKIQGELGAESLSKTCKDYPRSGYIIGNTLYKNINNSCEVMLKKLLNDTNSLSDNLYETDKKPEISQIIDKNPRYKKSLITKFSEIHKLCIDILQTRGISFDNRMILLGEYLYAIDGLIKDLRYDEALQITANFAQDIEKYISLFALDVKNHDLACNLYMINNEKIGNIIDTVESSENLTSVIGKIYNIRQEKNYDEYSKYAQNRDMLLKEYEHFFENVIINHINFVGAPYDFITDKKNISTFESYKKLVWTYCNLKITYAGALSDEKEVNFDEIIDLSVQIFRKLQHTTNYFDNVLNALNKSSFNKVLHFALLIKSS